MHKIIHKRDSYSYSTDNDDHAKEKSICTTKFFEEKTKMKHKDTVEKIMYDSDIGGLHNSVHDSSVTCKYIYIIYYCLKINLYNLYLFLNFM